MLNLRQTKRSTKRALLWNLASPRWANSCAKVSKSLATKAFLENYILINIELTFQEQLSSASILPSMTIPKKKLISQRPIPDFRDMKGSTNLEDQSLSMHFRMHDLTNVNTPNKLASLWKLWCPGVVLATAFF